ncbi:SRPBCC family protein [soil metagenome]
MSEGPFELSLTRLIDAPVETVWQVWTQRLVEWWAQRPWTTQIIEQDLRAGGRSAMVMVGPNGETSPVEGVTLEVIQHQRIVFTDAFRVGWVPQPPFMTGIFSFAAEGDKTLYTAAARHWDEATMKQHEDMGFQAGWGQVADQFKTLCEGGTLG